jgi:hypothetical protein
MLRALFFSFPSSSHSHRHSAEKWADRGGSRPTISPGRADPPRSAHLSPERESQRKSECFALFFIFSSTTHSHRPCGQIIGRTAESQPYRFESRYFSFKT